MTKEKTTKSNAPKSNTPRPNVSKPSLPRSNSQKSGIPTEKVIGGVKKSLQLILSAFSKWWLSMTAKIGATWSLVIVLIGLFCMFTGYFLIGLLYIFVAGPIAMFIVKYARPSFIMTRGSLLWAKLTLDVGYPVFALFLAWLFTHGCAIQMAEQAAVKSNYEIACSAEGIKKSGTAGCKKAKETFRQQLQDQLTPAKQKYAEISRLVDQYAKEKAKKCTEQGIAEYGSDGCEQATSNLARQESLKNEYQEKIDSLTQKIDELKK